MPNKELNKEKLKALQLTMEKLDKTYGKGAVMKLGDSPNSSNIRRHNRSISSDSKNDSRTTNPCSQNCSANFLKFINQRLLAESNN